MEKGLYVSGRQAHHFHSELVPEDIHRDYRGLKKRITVIRKAQQGLNFHVIPSDESPDEVPSPPAAPRGSDVDSKFSRQTINAPRNSMETTGSIHSQHTNFAYIPASETERRVASEDSKASPIIARSRPSFSISLRRGQKFSFSGRSAFTLSIFISMSTKPNPAHSRRSSRRPFSSASSARLIDQAHTSGGIIFHHAGCTARQSRIFLPCKGKGNVGKRSRSSNATDRASRPP